MEIVISNEMNNVTFENTVRSSGFIFNFWVKYPPNKSNATFLKGMFDIKDKTKTTDLPKRIT